MGDAASQFEPKPTGPVGGDLIAALWGAGVERPAGNRWFVLHTLPRQEKALAESLDSQEVRYFLPLVRRMKYYGHRSRQTNVPLFSGYLFLWGDKESSYRAIGTKRVAGVIEVADQARLEGDLLQLKRAMAGGVALEPYRYLEVGRRCRVTAGPLAGVEGLIESFARADRLVLQVHALGQAVSAVVDPSLVETLDV